MSAVINGHSTEPSPFNTAIAEAAHASLAVAPGVGFERVAKSNSSGIRIIIVGAGFAGLACAIECRRKGHEVVVLEKFKELKVLGEPSWSFLPMNDFGLNTECRRCE